VWDLGPHSQAIKGPREYYCALLSMSPQLFTKGWATHTHTHTQNIAAKWWRRLQQLLPLCPAQSGSTTIAQRRTSPVLCKLCDSSNTLLFVCLIQAVLVRQAANQSAEQSPFSWHDLHRPHYSRKSLFTRLYCQPKNQYIGQQWDSLT